MDYFWNEFQNKHYQKSCTCITCLAFCLKFLGVWNMKVKVIRRSNVGWPVAWTRSATQFINWISFVTKLMFNYCHITEVIIHYLNELLKNCLWKTFHFIIVRWFFRSFFTYFHFLQILVRPKVLPVWHLVAALY